MEWHNANLPYSPDLAPSSYHFFGKLKESGNKTRFEDDNCLENAAKKWLRHNVPHFYCAGTQTLVPRRRNTVGRDRDYVGKWNFVPLGCITMLYK